MSASSPREGSGHGAGLPLMDLPERFRDAVMSGTKLAASLPEQLGEVGTSFIAFGVEFTLIDVRKVALELVAAYLYRPEGFETKEDFIQSWCEQHPDIGYQPARTVYVHLFVKAGAVQRRG